MFKIELQKKKCKTVILDLEVIILDRTIEPILIFSTNYYEDYYEQNWINLKLPASQPLTCNIHVAGPYMTM